MRTLETDALGNVVSEERGANGQMTISREHDPVTGRVLRICADKSGGPACQLVDEGYGWDKAGNLHTQQKEGRYVEGFAYDELSRLTNSYFLQIGAASYAPYERTGHWAVYDAVGNICARTINGAGRTLGYAGRAGCGVSTTHGSGTTSTVGAHRVSTAAGSSYAYDARGNQTVRDAAGTADDRSIAYSVDNKAYSISRGSPAAPAQAIRFWYGPDGQRYKREDSNGKRTLYLGNVEIVSVGSAKTIKRHIAGAVLQTIVGTTTTSRYLFHDQLGNVVRITDAAGAVQDTLDYIPAGARRNPVDPALVVDGSPAVSDRGFTGHEHLDGVGVIHMNGRTYDPSLGRFLQPDPFVQAPGSAQSWNAYTYVFNNPLRYTDPTGMLGQSERGWLGAIIMIAAVVTQQYWAAGLTGETGAAIVLGAYAGVGFVAGAVASQSWQGGLMGAMTALITAGVGMAMVEGGLVGWGLQTFSGGVMGSLRGGNFGHSFVNAGLSAAFMPQRGQIDHLLARTITGVIVGGTISRATGGKFANGAVVGAIQAAMTKSGETREENKGFSGGASAYDTTPHTTNPPAELHARMTNSDLGTQMDSFWEGMRHANRESGFAAFVSDSDAEAPLLYRSFPSPILNPETGRYDYFDRAAMISVLTPPLGYKLYLTFHGHPWSSGFSFIKRWPGFVISPAGPSPADGAMAEEFPNSHHVVRWRTAGMTFTGYYGPMAH